MIIKGKNIILRTVELEDAEFIYKLRRNPKRSKYMNKISSNIEKQIEWIKKYKMREKNDEEYYFVIESLKKEKLGLIRMYDFKEVNNKKVFSIGSWIFKENVNIMMIFESLLRIYEFGFHKKNFELVYFNVKKDNIKVFNHYKKKLKANLIKEDENYFYFSFSYKNLKKRLFRYFQLINRFNINL